MPATLRYVPQGPASLSSDAPGWSAGNDETDDRRTHERGPTCWKCKGRRSLPLPKKQKRQAADDGSAASAKRTCPVCKGEGRLPVRSKLIRSREEPGAITSRRRRPRGWVEFGHVPPAVRAALALKDDGKTEDDVDDVDGKNGDAAEAAMGRALYLLSRANGRDDDYDTKRRDVPVTLSSEDQRRHVPAWLPINPGEQLCNLVGRWRILQRVASHRWTTDDLVTAYVAASAFVSSLSGSEGCTDEKKRTIRYLDLGTGNASVLQMASWYLLSNLEASRYELEAAGVEARSEAVGLARRSLSFNLGEVEYQGKVYEGGLAGSDATPMESEVRIVQGDFRDLVALSTTSAGTDLPPTEKGKDSGSAWGLEDVASRRYDLITGTPPYFRVDFKSSKGTRGGNDSTSVGCNDEEVITSAVINQGGMPTSMQSAPARCEFRGGVEAYCAAASAVLADGGRFFVCENWLNDDRVYAGAREAGLTIECVCPVAGAVGKGNLFAVYAMRKADAEDDGREAGDVPEGAAKVEVRPSLVVRAGDGEWTEEYAKVMEAMSVPVV